MFKSVTSINKQLEEDIHKQIHDLNDLTGEHAKELEFLKNDAIIKTEDLTIRIDGIDERMTKTEKLNTDSDLFGLPGNLHVIKIKLAQMKGTIDHMVEEANTNNLNNKMIEINVRVDE